jgi:hypothetical protein
MEVEVAMDRYGLRSPAAASEFTTGVSALAADIEELVDRFAEECERGLVTQGAADELSVLVTRAQRLSTAR